MSDPDLHALLHRVVPAPPDPDPVLLAGLGRRRRARRRTAVVGGAVAAVLAVLVVTTTLGGGEGRSVLLPAVTPTQVPSSTTTPVTPVPSVSGLPDTDFFDAVDSIESYEVNTCVPEDQRTVSDEVDTSEVVAVVECSYAGFGRTSAPLTPDAYVGEMGALTDALRERPMSQDECNLLSLAPRGRIVLTLDDGTRVELGTDLCDEVRVDGLAVVVFDLTKAFTAALDQQRDLLSPPGDLVVGAPRCFMDSTGGPTGPVRPERDQLAYVAGCLSGNDPRLPSVSLDALAVLQERWTEARPVPEPDRDRCVYDADYITGFLVARTVRNDVVTLTQSPCGYLVAGGVLGIPHSTPYAVEATFADLGLADDLARAIDAATNVGP